MTKVYAALALLAVIIAAGAAEYRISIKTADEMLSAIEDVSYTLESSTDSTKASVEICCDIRDKWQNRRTPLMLFLPHADIDITDIAAEKLVVYAESGDEEQIKITLAELENQMHNLKDNEGINIYNFL